MGSVFEEKRRGGGGDTVTYRACRVGARPGLLLLDSSLRFNSLHLIRVRDAQQVVDGQVCGRHDDLLVPWAKNPRGWFYSAGRLTESEYVYVFLASARRAVQSILLSKGGIQKQRSGRQCFIQVQTGSRGGGRVRRGMRRVVICNTLASPPETTYFLRAHNHLRCDWSDVLIGWLICRSNNDNDNCTSRGLSSPPFE